MSTNQMKHFNSHQFLLFADQVKAITDLYESHLDDEKVEEGWI